MEKKYFLETAKPTRENFLQSITEDEKAVMTEHLAFVKQMTEEGKIFFSGACLDGALGLIVYQAEDFESASEMYKNDPLVCSGIAKTELHPFKIGELKRND